jgi:hypothetical protein
MNYQDHHTKFCVLRTLTQKCAREVAGNLIEIFLTFNAPFNQHLVENEKSERMLMNQRVRMTMHHEYHLQILIDHLP